MQVKIVYGAPCSGKSTYVDNNIGDSDLRFDWDKVLNAITNRKLNLVQKHNLSFCVLDLRRYLVELAKEESDKIDTFYFICTNITDTVKELFEGIEYEKVIMPATKEECYERLDRDKTRPDKEEWRKLIDKWFADNLNDRRAKQPMNKFWNWVQDSDTGGNTLILNGVISEESWLDDDITPRLFRDELTKCKGDITVWINSPGGDVFAAAQIYNMLNSYPGDVNVRIDGLAASAATVIAMAGKTVEMSPVGMFMIHNPATLAWGEAKEMQAALDQLNEVKESIINAYEMKTKLPRNQISEMMDAETWMNAKKAKELGFVDKILFQNEDEENSIKATMFSRARITNSLVNKLRTRFADKRADEKPEEKVDDRVSVDALRKRLDLIIH